MVLGPFQGKIACVRILSIKGYVDITYANLKFTCVPDVHKFESHIACDSATNRVCYSYIIQNDKVLALLDIDSGFFW